MSLMTGIYVGVSGLQSSQTGLNVTSHNLANVYTAGYVRQQVSYQDKNYQTIKLGANNVYQVGLGVTSDDTRHLRDYFLDMSYRTESGREGFYNSQYTAVEEVESIFGELEGVAFQDSLKDLYSAISTVATQPNSTVARSALVMCSEAFLTRANAIYSDLKSYQETLNTKVQGYIDKINNLGNTISTLNKQIVVTEASGIEAANDLRDKRDNALDQLSQYVGIQYEEDINGCVTVKIEGTAFVTENTVFPMGTAQLDTDKDSEYLSVVWPHLNNQEVYYLDLETSTAKGNDIGSLKGLLMARGDYIADYSTIPHEPVKPVESDYASEDEFKAAITDYYKKYEEYEQEVKEYEGTVGYSSIMETQAMFDQLINGIAEAINKVLCPEVTKTLTSDTTYTLEDGTTVTYPSGTELRILDTDNCSTGSDADKTVGEELFSRSDTQRYTKATDATGKTIYIYNDTNEFGTKSLYKLGNLEINQNVLADYSKLPFTTQSGDMDMAAGQALIDAWETPFANLNPDNLTAKNFSDYYNALIGTIANTGSLYEKVSTNQVSVTSNIDAKRQSQTGVSSEEELTNMMKFQNAYNASSRYINVISDMLDHIISRLGA